MLTTFTVSDELFQSLVRYTKFSAASYAGGCPTPPNGATVANFFSVASTDTQGYLFRDDTAKELILAFRGTSDLQDFAVDLNQTLIPYESVGISGCDGCQVRFSTVLLSIVLILLGPRRIRDSMELCLLRSYRLYQHTNDVPFRIHTHSHRPFSRWSSRFTRISITGRHRHGHLHLYLRPTTNGESSICQHDRSSVAIWKSVQSDAFK